MHLWIPPARWSILQQLTARDDGQKCGWHERGRRRSFVMKALSLLMATPKQKWQLSHHYWGSSGDDFYVQHFVHESPTCKVVERISLLSILRTIFSCRAKEGRAQMEARAPEVARRMWTGSPCLWCRKRAGSASLRCAPAIF
jgi:hypothetical protein